LNLIITCPRHFEEETKEEITKFCNEFGDDNPEFNITNMPGIITGKTSLNPVEVIQKIREKILDEPWSIRYCQRIIPIQTVCNTNIDEIKNEIQKKIGVFKPEESYRITIEKRNFKISSNEIISEIAKNIPNKVSLEHADWMILVEIIENETGIAIVPNNSILSVEKVKRSLSD
jgi:tRNA acetyltransferase TAN1